MTNKTEIYRSAAVMQKNALQTAIALLFVAAFCAAVFIAAQPLPATWLFEIAAVLISAVLINKILKQGTFAMTYVLYEDRLVVITRYGLIEKVTAEYMLDKVQFTASSVKAEGKVYPFYPDEELKKLLKLENPS